MIYDCDFIVQVMRGGTNKIIDKNGDGENSCELKNSDGYRLVSMTHRRKKRPNSAKKQDRTLVPAE